MDIGHLQLQPAGYKAFVPSLFPPEDPFAFSSQIELKHAQAMRLVGKLDGITQLLPDKDFFLLMFVTKEAASSSQIEGTQATMVDAIEAEIAPKSALPADVEDISYYVRALNYGIERFKTLPLSIRFIREIHDQLMKGARSTQKAFPGDFRYTQNWIGGTSPSNAKFVPPPPHEMVRAMGELEKFIHEKDNYPPLIKAALIHAQFETIHPFVDGNGRTGRLVVTFYLWQEELLEVPLLYLSHFFKKNQDLYYSCLQGYHGNPAEIERWVDFFLDGIIETADSAIEIARNINRIREQDMAKVHKLGKTAAETAIEVLRNLYKQPIIDVKLIQKWTGFSWAGAQKVIDRLIDLEILVLRNPEKNYGKTYEYRSYLSLFQ